MKEAMISVLMPVKNAEPFLQVCLDSILSQSYSAWELIAIDDHSSDQTLSYLQDYSRRDKRIKVYGNAESGIIAALRLAFSKSRGRLITRMDADDIMSEDKLQLLSENLIQKGRGFISIGLVKYFSKTNLGEGYLKYEKWLNGLALKENSFDEIYKECVIPSPCWMCFREDLLKVNAFDSNVYPEDYDLCFRFRNAGFQITTVKKVLHHWRDHESRSSRNDPNYSDNSFLDLKLLHFQHFENIQKDSLILWGAGNKGKYIAQQLLSIAQDFRWISNNPKKIDKEIYNVLIENSSAATIGKNANIIVAIAMKGINTDLNALNRRLGANNQHTFFHFC